MEVRLANLCNREKLTYKNLEEVTSRGRIQLSTTQKQSRLMPAEIVSFCKM